MGGILLHWVHTLPHLEVEVEDARAWRGDDDIHERGQIRDSILAEEGEEECGDTEMGEQREENTDFAEGE